MNVNISTFMDNFEKAKNVCIAGHVNPDGDAVGACFAMALAAVGAGKTPVVLLENYSSKYDFLEGGEYVYTGDLNDLSCDFFISLDCASKERLGSAAAVFDKSPVTYNIDHHASNTNYATYNYVEQNASSTCEIVHDIINMTNVVTKDIAAALYTGIVFDTGSFRHKNTSPKTHNIVSNLLLTGIDFSDIQRRVALEHSLVEANAFGTALSTLTIVPEINFAYVTLSAEQISAAGASYADLDGIVEYVLNIKDVEAAALFTEREGNVIKASLRSKNIQVNDIAGLFGGGGHVNAAGTNLEAPMSSAIEKITAEIFKAMKK